MLSASDSEMERRGGTVLSSFSYVSGSGSELHVRTFFQNFQPRHRYVKKRRGIHLEVSNTGDLRIRVNYTLDQPLIPAALITGLCGNKYPVHAEPLLPACENILEGSRLILDPVPMRGDC